MKFAGSKLVTPTFDLDANDAPIDDYLPQNGNRGYRVSRYELDLEYKVESNRLAGKAKITAVTTATTSKFAFDLGPALTVSKVTVNGSRSVKFSQHRGKLKITPAKQIASGAALVVVIQYAGTPKPINGFWGEVGWDELTEGSIVASQPNGAASWFPCDDHPVSKASYGITITTDSPYYAVANGTLVRKQTRASRTTWVYEQPEPMATYLATIQIGPYSQHTTSPGPVLMKAVLPHRLRANFDHDFGRQTEMMSTFERLYGPYPFAAYTVVITDDDLEIPIEAQGLSIFGANHCSGTRYFERLVAHELAHQWFGNSLTLGKWKDIWLHEGFACYSEWIWAETSDGTSARDKARRVHTMQRGLPRDLILGDPGPAKMFDDRVYKRGALTLHALRTTIGDEQFFGLIQEWTSKYRYSTVCTADFIDLATRFGCPRSLWEAWLESPQLPALP
ncbi:M1 family metallopeptidase [Rhodococcus sp. P1Y]|uniref:M1 family metallopeptidase n=1 Tax=Rhodococcus sp. P1Y TaxID=1302308 RepID=UPI000EB4F806|nr:M1 family metallopeptidase [Rhodococcus sp. P1Y]AYJ47029.1 M1 family peptidase [Rhodococcus sp. P1Y]